MTPPLGRFEWERLIRDLDGMPPSAKNAAFALATWAENDGTNAHPGIIKLAKATGLSRRAVIDALAFLENAGFITASYRGGTKNVSRGNATVYDLAVPDALWPFPKPHLVQPLHQVQ